MQKRWTPRTGSINGVLKNQDVFSLYISIPHGIIKNRIAANFCQFLARRKRLKIRTPCNGTQQQKLKKKNERSLRKIGMQPYARSLS